MTDYYLKVFLDKSELVHSDNKTEIFLEGSSSVNAKVRYKKIADALKDGFLEKLIVQCKDNPSAINFSGMSSTQIAIFDKLVSSITSEVGRALVGLTVLQLSVKSIIPEQSIRLHKAGNARNNFSWKEGISMRSLDSHFITPMLRKHDLLKLNSFGFMMTRSLAENYPYSKVYKANMRGARNEWLEIVEEVELNKLNPLLGLQYLLSQLINNAQAFKVLASETLTLMEKYIAQNKPFSKEEATKVIVAHTNSSDYAARLMEISMHSLIQALQELGVMGGLELKPLSQMRSANKKHGNIADVEIADNGEIVEAWDAKYGKQYLRDELEELADKLSTHEDVDVAGFVTSVPPIKLDELEGRMKDIEDTYGAKIMIVQYEEWVNIQFEKTGTGQLTSEEELSKEWIRAYVESIAQMRRDIAPIDEPCQHWLISLKKIFEIIA